MIQQVPAAQQPDSDPRVELAVQRTELALERTQLAWVRTGLALLGTSIAVDKGLELLRETRLTQGNAWLHHAHGAALFISAIAVTLLTISAVDYCRTSRTLATMRRSGITWRLPALIASILVILLGIIIFIALFRDIA